MDHDHSHHSMPDHSGHHHHMSPSDIVNDTILTNISSAMAAGMDSISSGLLNNISASGNFSDFNMDHSGHMDHSEHMGMDHSGHMAMDHPMGHSGHDMRDMKSGGMKMYFHVGVDEVILFKGWSISTVGGLIGSMVGIFILALFYEGLKYFREYLFKRSLANSQYAATCSKGPSNQDKPVQYMDQVLLPAPMHILSGGHILQTGLHMFQFIISYCLMLIFMTYNVWLCLACTLGAGVGYFLFGWKKSVVVDVTEHCH